MDEDDAGKASDYSKNAAILVANVECFCTNNGTIMILVRLRCNSDRVSSLSMSNHRRNELRLENRRIGTYVNPRR